jgi:NADPH:quinone reductase-like Zn-dependent oxidoreductase
MNTSGGFSQYIRIPSRWLVRLPETLSLRHSMVLGTAGLTAALCIEKLLNNGVRPEQGDVLVTGATGGVGSIAVALLSLLGFSVTACTGKPQQAGYLSLLGARAIVSRAELVDSSTRPLLKERWAAAVDVAGGDLLWSILRSLHYSWSILLDGIADAALAIDGNTAGDSVLANSNWVYAKSNCRASLGTKMRANSKAPALVRGPVNQRVIAKNTIANQVFLLRFLKNRGGCSDPSRSCKAFFNCVVTVSTGFLIYWSHSAICYFNHLHIAMQHLI